VGTVGVATAVGYHSALKRERAAADRFVGDLKRFIEDIA